MTRQEIEKICKQKNITVLFADGFDDAIIGIGKCFQYYKVVYHKSKIIDIIINEWGLSLEEAEEYYEYNISGSYVGEQTPVFLEF